MPDDECQKLYGYLFDGRLCPADLATRYSKACNDLSLPELKNLPDNIGITEFSERKQGTPNTLTAKLKLVAYLAETSAGHYELMHTPRPRHFIAVLCDMGMAFMRAKLGIGTRHGI